MVSRDQRSEEMALLSINFSFIFSFFSENNDPINLEEAIHKIYVYISPINRRMLGCPVTVNSVPYKNLLLFNSRSRGVISSILGKRKCMFLTDVKLAAGCEGSPVYS